MNLLDFSKKRILITGASSGIGRETAVLLSKLGADLLLVGRNADGLQKTLALLAKGDHHLQQADLAETESILTWVKTNAQQHGCFDGLVHSAGLHSSKPLRFLKAAEIEKVMTLNVTSAIYLAKAFRQSGVYNPGASIVYLASVVGLVGQSGVSAYSASKGAVIALTKSLALELAKETIRVNCVAPGVVETEMTEQLFSLLEPTQIESIVKMHPLGLGKAGDVAYSITFLLSSMSRWLTGTVLTVDGGYTAQ